MPTEIRLPALSESINEGVVSEVRVKSGDTIKAGDIVVVVEAEKSTVEVPADSGGKVTEVLVKKGDTVKVGQVLARAESGAPASSPPPKQAESPAEVHSAPRTTTTPTPRVPAQVKAATASNGEHADGPRTANGVATIPAGPATRRLARKLGIDLVKIAGSGPRGRITQDDVIAFSQQGRKAGGGGTFATPALPDFSKWGPIDVQPLDLIRRKTAEQMAIAWSQVAHVTQHDQADVTELDAFRKTQDAPGPKLTVTAFALKAAAVALKEFPQFNSSLDLDNGKLVRKGYFNIGVAVDTERGLLVPVIRAVDRKSVRELAGEIAEIAERARQKKLGLDEMKGGTFTVTNLGGIGGVGFTPIVNWPEVAILGLSRSKLVPAVKDGVIIPRLMLPMSLSYDHRVIDGADAARFTRRIAQMLENPMLLLIEA